MKIFIQLKLWKHFQGDSLFRNSIYLMASTGVMAVLGFAFWIFVARLFSPREVGIATTLISVTSLISSVSLLGFNTSLIRYLPGSENKNEKINSAILLVIFASILASTVFILGLTIFSPRLLFLRSNVFYIFSFIVFMAALSLNTIIESVFIAHRASGNILVKNIIYSLLKLGFPVLFVSLGAYGIFSSVSLAILIGSIFGFFVLLSKYAYQPKFNFHKDVIKEMAFFSGGNYLAGLFSQMSSLVLPLLIVNLLNAEAAAYYYVSSMIANFLSIISQSTTQSLLAEGSHDISAIRKNFSNSLKILAFLLIPAVLIIVLFGNLILHAFGKSYATEGFTFLRIVSISTIFTSICSLGNSLLRLKHKIASLVGLNAFNALFTLCVLSLIIPRGLISIGWGLLLTQVAVTVVYFFYFWKRKLL